MSLRSDGSSGKCSKSGRAWERALRGPGFDGLQWPSMAFNEFFDGVVKTHLKKLGCRGTHGEPAGLFICFSSDPAKCFNVRLG